MFSIWLQEHGRRRLLPALALVLALGYFLGLRPLAIRADKLDEPLDRAWRTLSAALHLTNNVSVDFRGITNQLDATRQAITALVDARRQAATRVDPGEAVREHMNVPFQFVDYESERGRRSDQLLRLATEHKVKIEPAVVAGFPEHAFDVRNPELLWAQLAAVEDIVHTAVRSRLTTLHSLTTFTPLTHAPGNGSPGTLTEIPVQLEFTGPATAIEVFLRSLPLRDEELDPSLVSERTRPKPSLFVERLILRKQSPEKPEEIRAAIRLVSFVLTE